MSIETLDQIAAGMVVEFHYTLTNESGELLDQSEEGEPLEYLHGAGNIVPGLEDAMSGHVVGDKFKVTVPPEEAYGLRDGDPKPVARSAFPEDAEVEAGMQFAVHGPDGRPVPVWVVDVEDDIVYIDFNHPLSGVALTFDVNVVSMRAATDEERQHGHPHGEGGHHHH